LSLSPSDAFDAARLSDRAELLDHVCQAAAIEGVVDQPLPAGFALFVNVEPDSSPGPCVSMSSDVTVVAEVTERALLHHPSRLIQTIRAIRERGCGIALDDVGALPETIALLPFVMPDIIKLDVSLVHAQPSLQQAKLVTAVNAYAERTGAIVLAEGIESQADFDQALTLGASLGQGWFFSMPGPLASFPRIRQPLRLLPWLDAPGGTPFDLLPSGRLRIGSKRQLLAISRHIEQQGMSLGTPPVVLSAFQRAENVTPFTARRYSELAEECPLVVAVGQGLASEPAPGVRGANLATWDPLIVEWTVAIVGSHYMGALIARDLGDSGPEMERRYEFALTHDHRTVVEVARLLLARLDAEPPPY
jgi:EAL domain-containing protein (putative c-di-GMP-specific phosphodiesterase class I)